MRFFHWTLLLFLFAWSCATAGTADQERIYPVYRDKIKEWQMRIQREGWSEAHLDSILFQFRRLATYRMEIHDHWDTPKEFIQKGFSGDCEDIAVFMMGTLKRLGYPNRIRILIVQAPVEDQARLRVYTIHCEQRGGDEDHSAALGCRLGFVFLCRRSLPRKMGGKSARCEKAKLGIFQWSFLIV